MTGILGLHSRLTQESGVLSRGNKGLLSLLESRRYFLEPTEWTKGSQASSGVWREDSGLHSRTCRKRRPSSHEDRGVSVVLPSCSAHGVFLPRHYKDLREPLVWHEGSQVSVHVARGSTSLLSSQGRGIGPHDGLKKNSRCLSRVAAGNPGFP